MLPRTLSLAEINSYLLRMRYNDTKQIAESKNKNLSQFCKTMTLGYGSTHSASASPKGLFNDPYHREAIETIGPVLFDVMLSCIHKEIEEKKSDLINGKSKTIDFLPVANYDTFKKILGKSYDDFFTDESYSINIAGKDIPLVKIKIPKDAENNGLMREIAIKIARNKIGSSGQFPNKYLQQWIVANLDDNSFNNTFKELLRGVEKRHDVKEPQIEYTPSTLSINDITKNIT
ncbi:MAG: hypothetical protein JO131_06455, partial [Gammaproteobacteria bacterium]|nr:hypothetical protein [Gammaproteobacteria bacterium]